MPTGNKKEQVLNAIKHRVLTLDILPGAPLDETRLAEQYGLSRTPLRELLQRLAGAGYLAIESNRGATASSMDMNTMRNFFQTAPMVYAAVARLATEQASQQQITALKKTQSKFEKAVNVNAVADMVMHNHRFHELTGEMANSPYLAPSLGRLLIDHTRMSHRFYATERNASRKRVLEACEQHNQMIDAIENRQAARVVELTLKHWELSRREMEKYVSPDPLPHDVNSFGIINKKPLTDVEVS